MWLATAQSTSGDTRQEILAATGFTDAAESGGQANQIAFGEAFRALQQSVSSPNVVSKASSLWTQQGAQWNPSSDTTRFLHDTVGASVHVVDFANAPEEARVQYNRWGAEVTDNMVKEALPEGSVTGDTRLIQGASFLAKLSWEEGFSKGNDQFGEPFTRPGSFTLSDGSIVEHPALMHKKSDNTRFFSSSQEGVTLGVFPYVGGDLSMVVVTSKNPKNFLEMEQGLTRQKFEDWLAQAAVYESLDVVMPKFEFETHARLNEVYQRLGIQMAYGAGADFSGIFPSLERGGLHLDSTISAAKITNDEDGTRVAEVVTNSTVLESLPSVGLYLNQPFVYVIYSKEYGPIAIGRYVAP